MCDKYPNEPTIKDLIERHGIIEPQPDREWAIGTASLYQTQNKLIRAPIGVASYINMINRVWDLP